MSAKYIHPIEEHRIFMFIDLKSATEIAEKLGHIRYFQLLNDFFADATKPILNTRGTIYQYIGDEISISWVVKGELMKPDCLNCFFGIEQIIVDRAAYYREKYNLVPKFKRGIHFGPVTTGQIGLIKKEIVHSGDVLNTASRIQNLCNQNDAKLIITGATLEKFINMEAYQSERIGNMALKGKSQRQELFKVEKAN